MASRLPGFQPGRYDRCLEYERYVATVYAGCLVAGAGVLCVMGMQSVGEEVRSREGKREGERGRGKRGGSGKGKITPCPLVFAVDISCHVSLALRDEWTFFWPVYFVVLRLHSLHPTKAGLGINQPRLTAYVTLPLVAEWTRQAQNDWVTRLYSWLLCLVYPIPRLLPFVFGLCPAYSSLVTWIPSRSPLTTSFSPATRR